MNKQKLIENFLDYRSFRIPVEDLDIARNHLNLFANDIIDACAKKVDYKIKQVTKRYKKGETPNVNPILRELRTIIREIKK